MRAQVTPKPGTGLSIAPRTQLRSMPLHDGSQDFWQTKEEPE